MLFVRKSKPVWLILTSNLNEEEIEMSRARIEVPQLENMVGAGKKKFVRYAEGNANKSIAEKDVWSG